MLFAANVGCTVKVLSWGRGFNSIFSYVFGAFLSRTSSTNHVQSACYMKKKGDPWKPYADGLNQAKSGEKEQTA